jgi:hypothetical protein
METVCCDVAAGTPAGSLFADTAGASHYDVKSRFIPSAIVKRS